MSEEICGKKMFIFIDFGSIHIKHWLKTDLRDVMSDTLNEEHITQDNIFNFSHIKT